jgi:hypothetical protein
MAELITLKPEQHQLTFVPKLVSELPFFNLTLRRKDIPKVIKYRGQDTAGRPIRWEVYQDTSEEIGPPGVEAHLIWVLLIKPAIDDNRNPDGSISEITPLGGMRECLRKVGWTEGGHQARELIKALTQISFAGCIADLWLPTGQKDEAGKDSYLQIKGRFSRMSVYAIGEHHLSEEELAKAEFKFELEDNLYIRLDPLEVKLQQIQEQRVLDNQYLFSVNPAARRWYELMAAKIFGVVKNKGQFCEIRYSWYIQHHHTLKRLSERFRVVEQMNRVVKNHLDSDYLAKVEYRAIKEPGEETDYLIRYYPGEGAKESIARIQGHLHRRKNQKKLTTKESEAQASEQGSDASLQPVEKATLSVTSAEDEHLIDRLLSEFGLGQEKAYELVRDKKEAVTLQLEYWPYRALKVKNQAGWLIRAIEGDYSAPEGYREAQGKAQGEQKSQASQGALEACPLCDSSGFRYLGGSKGVKKCSHNPDVEAKYPST